MNTIRNYYISTNNRVEKYTIEEILSYRDNHDYNTWLWKNKILLNNCKKLKSLFSTLNLLAIYNSNIGAPMIIKDEILNNIILHCPIYFPNCDINIIKGKINIESNKTTCLEFSLTTHNDNFAVSIGYIQKCSFSGKNIFENLELLLKQL